MIGGAPRTRQRRTAPAGVAGRPGRRARLPLAAALAAVTILASVFGPGAARPAFALADWFGVEAAGMENKVSGTAAIDSDTIDGTQFDFQDTLGLKDTDISTMARVWFRLGKKNHLSFDYFDANHSGSETLTAPLVFNGHAFLPGEEVHTDQELTLYQARYRYHFLDLKVFEFGLGVGVNQAKLNMQLQGAVSGGQDFDKSVTVPSASGFLAFKFLPGLHIKAEAEYFHASSSSDLGDLRDYRAQLEWYFLHVFGIMVGYRSLHFAAETNAFGNATLDYKGPYAGLGVKF
jgi:hypothetical protein